MATTYATIISAALNRSTVNDGGATTLGSDTAELVGFLSRVVRQVYSLAGVPRRYGGMAAGNYFLASQTVTLATPATTFTALPTSPEYVYVVSVTDNGGDVVSVVPLRDLRDGIAEVPPAVVIANGKIRSAGRTGDPTAGAVLTLEGSYLPAEATSGSHYVGATTASDSTTTYWPGHAGDPFLIAQLARYLVIKDAMRDANELQALDAEIAQAAEGLAHVIQVSPAALVAVRDS